MLQPAREMENAEFNHIWIMTIVCKRVGLGTKMLHKHPETHWSLWRYELDTHLFVLRSPPFYFSGIGAHGPLAPLWLRHRLWDRVQDMKLKSVQTQHNLHRDAEIGKLQR